MAFVLLLFANWWSRQNRRNGRSSTTTRVLGRQFGPIPNASPADVEISLGLALKRLLPVMTSLGAHADVAVQPGLLVPMTGAALADLLEDLLATAVHHAHASHLLLTAVGHGEQVHIRVTDDAPGMDPALLDDDVRDLRERIALRGCALQIEVWPA